MFTTNDVLAKVGLQTRTTWIDYVLPALGLFGAGMVLGTGITMLIAPKSGAQLRRDIVKGVFRRGAKMTGSEASTSGNAHDEEEELHEGNAERGPDGRYVRADPIEHPRAH